MSCNNCSEIQFELDNFSLTRKCESDYHTKIHEALLKKHSPSLSGNFMLEVRLFCFSCFNSVSMPVPLKTFVIYFAPYCPDRLLCII